MNLANINSISYQTGLLFGSIEEILDGICDDGEWAHEIPGKDEFAVANIVRYKETYSGQPLELMFVVFSGNPQSLVS